MRVLNVDLDFFVSEVAYMKDDDNRLESKDYPVWTHEEVRSFLGRQCGLSRKKRTLGRIVVHHHEAFLFWRELVLAEELSTPFEIVHVDAHSDLGLGDGGWRYLMTDLLHQNVEDRFYPITGMAGMNESNYLAFAVACRWVSSLTQVRHPKGSKGLMPYHFKDFSPATNLLELKRCSPQALFDEPTYESFGVEFSEPTVPFVQVAADDFKETRPFDYIVLSLSPGFTPIEADALVPVFKEHIDEV